MFTNKAKKVDEGEELHQCQKFHAYNVTYNFYDLFTHSVPPVYFYTP